MEEVAEKVDNIVGVPKLVTRLIAATLLAHAIGKRTSTVFSLL